jgi:nucleoside-diphosphate-sugar epimerase
LKIIITGGSGYLGTHVRRFFNADDFSRRSHLDILNPNDVALIADYDVVIHLAAHLDKDPSASETCFRTNAEGTLNVLQHVRPGAVFIYASTKDVYGAHADLYAEVAEDCSTAYCGQSALEWSKLVGEHYVDFYAATRGFRACIFRLSAVYARPTDDNEAGFVTHYVESVKRGWPIKLPLNGTPVRDILHVDDFSRACRAFIESSQPRGLYNLGGGARNARSLREIVETIGRLIEIKPLIYVTAQLVAAPVPLNYVSDLTHVRSELGWQPEIGVEEGLQSLL